jgi:hypothetical protein
MGIAEVFQNANFRRTLSNESANGTSTESNSSLLRILPGMVSEVRGTVSESNLGMY